MVEKTSCGICGGNSILTTTTYHGKLKDGTSIVIYNVPCYRCTQCGEEVFLFDTLDKIDEIKANLGPKKEAFYAVA